MNKIRVSWLIGFLSLSFACTAQPAKRIFDSFEHNGQKTNYGILLPSDYDPTKTYPVVIGPSPVKDKNDQSYYWKGIKDTGGWIIIDFPIYDGAQNSENMRAFLNFILHTYNVEGKKFHTICFSANSASIFDLVMLMPDYFHSITGVAGNPATSDSRELSALKKVKVQFIVGDQDSYWMSAAKDRHAKLLAAGVDSRIEIIKDGEHVLTQLVGAGILSRLDRLRSK